MPASPPLDPVALRSLIAASPRWQVIDHVTETGSTNRDLSAWASTTDERLTRVLISEHQTAGRGRFARQWSAPPGSSLAVSVAVWPDRALADWTWLPLVAGVAVVRALRETALPGPLGDRLVLKWPNDVLVSGDPVSGDVGAGKLCGILAERADNPGLARAAAIIGMGINVSMSDDELPVPTATSLALAGGATDRTALVAALLAQLDRLLQQWGSAGHVRADYTAECASIGLDLRVQVGDDQFVDGRGAGVDEEGRLLVETAAGRRAFSAGDVVHLRPRA